MRRNSTGVPNSMSLPSRPHRLAGAASAASIGNPWAIAVYRLSAKERHDPWEIAVQVVVGYGRSVTVSPESELTASARVTGFGDRCLRNSPNLSPPHRVGAALGGGAPRSPCTQSDETSAHREKDQNAARFLYGEHFEFEPQFKLVLVTNRLEYRFWRPVGNWPFAGFFGYARQLARQAMRQTPAAFRLRSGVLTCLTRRARAALPTATR